MQLVMLINLLVALCYWMVTPLPYFSREKFGERGEEGWSALSEVEKSSFRHCQPEMTGGHPS